MHRTLTTKIVYNDQPFTDADHERYAAVVIKLLCVMTLRNIMCFRETANGESVLQ